MTSTPQLSRKHCRRLRARLIVRAVLLLPFVIAVWGSFMVMAANRQKAAVAALLKADIAVHYDYQRDELDTWNLTFPEGHRVRQFDADSFTNRVPVHPTPRWLRRLTGDEYFQTVAAVSIFDIFRTDLWESSYRSYIEASLPHLHKLPHLKEIFLHAPRDHADSPIFSDVKKRLKQEFPHAEVIEIDFVTRA